MHAFVSVCLMFTSIFKSFRVLELELQEESIPMCCWEINLAPLKTKFLVSEFSLQPHPFILLSFSTSITSPKKYKHE